MTMLLGLLKVLHYAGLFMGGGSAFGAMILGLTAPSAPVEHRPTLGAMARRFKTLSHVALGLLLLTGIVMASLTGAWSSGGVWFWIKLLAVAVLIVGIVLAGKAGARALAGDAEAAARARSFGMLNHASLLVVLIAAVAAFH